MAMRSSNYSPTSTPIFILLILSFQLAGCSKDDDKMDLHGGWHESMKGKIMYSIQNYGEALELYVIDKDGKRQLSPEREIQGLMEFDVSPDGSTVAITEVENGLSIMDIEGKNISNIVDHEDVRHPSWSPDGSKIAYIMYSPNRIVIYDMENAETTSFYFGDPQPFGDFGASVLDWSTTGSGILFKHGPSMNMLDATDSTINTVFNYDCLWGIRDLEWSPDGNTIAIIESGVQGAHEVKLINPDGSNHRLLISLRAEDLCQVIYDLAWSPDGSMIAVTGGNGIYVIRTNGSVVTKLYAASDTPMYIDWF